MAPMRKGVIFGLACFASASSAFTACTEPTTAPPAVAVSDAAVEAAPEQAGSQPSSASSIPADHETSTTAVSLINLFKPPEAPGGLVATIGGEKVTVTDIEQELREIQIQLSATGLPDNIDQYQVWRGALDRQIEKVVRKRLGDDLKVEVKEADVQAWTDDLKKRMEANPSFKVFLARAGKTPEKMRLDAEQAVLLDGIVDKLRIDVATETATKAQAYYDRNKRDFLVREGKEAWRLFVNAPRGMVQRDRDVAKERAKSMHAKAKKLPGNFENLVKSNSEGGKRMHGGYLGFISKGTLDKVIEEQLFAARPGTILPLREEPAGFYIYKAGKYRQQRTKPFTEVQEEILNKVFQREITKKVSDRLEELRKDLPVKILAPKLAELEALHINKIQENQRRMKEIEARQRGAP